MAKSSIPGRLDRIEKLLKIDTNKEKCLIVMGTPYQPGMEPEIPEPYEEWITYKQAVELAENRGYLCTMFLTDRIREAGGEGRYRLYHTAQRKRGFRQQAYRN